MENVDFDEEEKARRKKESIEWRTKKRTANIFLFCMTLFEILVTVLIMLVLFILAAKITFSIGDATSSTVQNVFLVILFIIFFGSLFLGFKVYKLFARFIIKKMNLEDKLPDDVMFHYKKQTKEEREAEFRK